MAKTRTIFRVGHRNQPYSMLANAMLRDGRLSMEARGALAMILSYPDNFQFSFNWLMREAQLGRARAYRIISELEAHGYCWRKQGRSGTGFGATVYLFTDKPANSPENMEIAADRVCQKSTRTKKAQSVGGNSDEHRDMSEVHRLRVSSTLENDTQVKGIRSSKNKKTAPLPPAPRVKPASGQGFEKGSEGDELIDIARRAEGLGIDADGLIVETEGANSHRAAFLAACHREISDRLPGIHRDVVGRALIGDAKAYSKLVQLVSTAELRP